MLCTILQDGPEDDDSWTTNGQADLEAELMHRQKELDSNVAKHAKRATKGLDDSGQAPEFDPSDMVAKLNVSCQFSCVLPALAVTLGPVQACLENTPCTAVTALKVFFRVWSSGKACTRPSAW